MDRVTYEAEKALDDAYDRVTAKSKFYTCSLKGICERSQTSKLTLKQCQEQCQSTEYRDLVSMIVAYEPSRGYELAPSDQIRVMSEIIGYKPSARVASIYFKALEDGDFAQMRMVTSTDSYRFKLYDSLDELIEYTKDIIGVDERLQFEEQSLRDEVYAIVQDASEDYGDSLEYSEATELLSLSDPDSDNFDDSEECNLVGKIYRDLCYLFSTRQCRGENYSSDVNHEDPMTLRFFAAVDWTLIIDIRNTDIRNFRGLKTV